jgi:hypothetical protein
MTTESKSLQEVLEEAQARTIGLFRSKYQPSDRYVPVVSEDNGCLVCLEVGTLLGLTMTYTDVTQGTYIKFPQTGGENEMSPIKDQTLADMLLDPVAFCSWYEKNVWPKNK